MIPPVQASGPSAVPQAGLAGAPRRPRVLAALSPGEMNEFLPEPVWGEIRTLAGEIAVVDAQQLKGDAIRDAIAGFDPEVLLASWRTDPLPDPLPPSLRYVCYLGGSIRRLVSDNHLAQGLLVSNWGDSISRVVAEGALMLVLMCLRRAGDWNTRMHRDGYWINGSVAPTGSLFERRVGLHGFGKVARALVNLLRPFRVTVSAFDPYVKPEEFARLGVDRAESLDALFSANDVVVELAALSAETEGAVSRRHFALLPDDGVFVNVGRGAVVDERALLNVAREGRLHLGLDVYHNEPLPADYPLRGLENVTLLPHVAGPTPDRRSDVGRFALANLKRYVLGLPLEARVTLEDYARAT